MTNIIIEVAAQAMILKNIRENKWGNSAKRQMREYLPLVLRGLENGVISIVDNKFYDTKYKLVGAIALFGDDEETGKSFFISENEVAQDYIRNRTIAEIAADITTQIISYYQFDNGLMITRGMKFMAILKGGE